MRLTQKTVAFAFGLLAASGAFCTTMPPPSGTAPVARPDVTTASAPGDAHVAVLTGEQVVQILDETVDWYRTLGVQQQNANQPSDLLILFANRQTADQVIALAFSIARANAELLSSEATATETAADAASPQALTEQQNQLAAQRQTIQAEMGEHRAVEGKLPELKGELAMLDARKNLLDTMSEFVNESDPKGAGVNALKAHIDAIAATIPPSAGVGSTAPSTSSGAAASAGSPTVTAPVSTPTRTGIWELGTIVFKLRNKIETIETIDRHTGALAATFQTISSAPLAQLKMYSSRSDALAKQADSAGSQALKGLRDQFDTLAWLFKQTSAILIPLTKEQVLLQQYRHNLVTWRDATRRQYREAWQTLGIRLGILLGILAAVVVLAEIWRRAVLRYAHEPRRRYQHLLIRKIVMWTLLIGIIGLSFVTEISALATFAGLLTAGVAVAMQSVLVSVVGYFFLIGKYGIRVGDRIQIGTVVGEVIDLGLVRMHLMEMNTQGPLGPTGRVVAFANLIVFQASGGLFKQIPGVNLSWRETTLALPTVDDYAALKDKMLSAIKGAVGEFDAEISRQTQEIVRSTASLSVQDATPQVQMRLVSGHMEALVRYAVNLQHAAQIEERVAEALLKVVAGAEAKSASAA
jgi:hypothetical protein